MGGVMEERDARLLLSMWSESGDMAIGARVRDMGAVAVVGEICEGRSRLAQAEAIALRRGDGDASTLLETTWAAAERANARYVIPGDGEWPTQLDDLRARMPLGLWVAGAGNLRLLALRSIAIVGARAATSYGESVARELGAHLAEEEWLTVSGGAFGIDAAAHRGAMAAEGVTACVLAGGVDVPYPRSHTSMLSRIRESGVLVSETPLGGAAMRHRFLSRNRLIAALSRATVVVEAAVRSGSRTTDREASELARVVMAFPGPVTSPLSSGCHALIRDGMAAIVTSPRDVLDLVSGRTPQVSLEPAALGWREQRVLDAVPLRRPSSLTNLARVAGLGTAEAMASIGLLDALGLVERRGDGWIRRQESMA